MGLDKADYGSLSCTVRDYKGKTAPVKIDGVPKAKLTTKNALLLAEFIQENSDAEVISYGVTFGATGDECNTGKYDRVLQRLRFFFKDVKTRKNRTFGIPAPKDEAVTADQEGHSDLPEDIMDLFKDLGIDRKNLRYNGSGLKSRIGKSISRNLDVTGA